jgi:hypothetical protein
MDLWPPPHCGLNTKRCWFGHCTRKRCGDRRFGDVLELQDAIALAVVRELQLTVVPADLDSRAGLKNTEAYALMLRGRHVFDRLDKEGLDEAVSLFQQALDRDPTLADAASWLGRAYVSQGDSGFALPGLVYEHRDRCHAGATLHIHRRLIISSDSCRNIGQDRRVKPQVSDD